MPQRVDIELVQVVDEPALPAVAQERPAPLSHSERLHGESLKAVMETYLQFYASGDTHTARAKRYDLMHFLNFLAGHSSRIESVLVSDWTLQATKDFVDARLNLGEAPATVGRRLATIKHFGRTLAERVHGYINPAREAKGPTLQTTRPHGLTEEAITLLRQAAAEMHERRPESFQTLRNRCLLELLLVTGLRADEVRLLTMAQLSDDLNWLKNVKTKGRKFRNVYVASEIRDLLRQYLDARRQELLEKVPGLSQLSAAEQNRLPVLISLYQVAPRKLSSYGLSPKTIWRIIANFGKVAQGLADSPIGNLHPHRLRHTFAHGLLNSSKDIRLVAQALGHSDVRTTMRYTERSEEEIAHAIESKRNS